MPLSGGSPRLDIHIEGEEAGFATCLNLVGEGVDVSVANGIATITITGGGEAGPHALDHQNGGSDEISVTGLSGLLADSQTPLGHNHAEGDITGLTAALAGKASLSHSHAQSEITGLVSALAGKLDSSTKLDDLSLPDDNTDLDASLTRHGLLKKLPGGTSTFLRADGTFATPAGGPGGSMASGSAIVNFGAFPGSSDSSVIITGQIGILSNSIMQAWLMPIATSDHSSDEHLLEPIKVLAGNIVPGSSFTVYALNNNPINEPLESAGIARFKGAVSTFGYSEPSVGGRGTRLYGQFTIGWLGNWSN